jgi:two-component SAPR family response regulator
VHLCAFSCAASACPYNVDLIFLDIEIPPVIIGFDFGWIKTKPEIIFITSKAEYALAFDTRYN